MGWFSCIDKPKWNEIYQELAPPKGVKKEGFFILVRDELMGWIPPRFRHISYHTKPSHGMVFIFILAKITPLYPGWVSSTSWGV